MKADGIKAIWNCLDCSKMLKQNSLSGITRIVCSIRPGSRSKVVGCFRTDEVEARVRSGVRYLLMQNQIDTLRAFAEDKRNEYPIVSEQINEVCTRLEKLLRPPRVVPAPAHAPFGYVFGILVGADSHGNRRELLAHWPTHECVIWEVVAYLAKGKEPMDDSGVTALYQECLALVLGISEPWCEVGSHVDSVHKLITATADQHIAAYLMMLEERKDD